MEREAHLLDLMVELLEDHGAAVGRISRVYAGASGEEEDLEQEILLQLWRSLPSFRGDAKPGTWLYRVALNTALTWRRRASRRPEPAEAGHRTPPSTSGAPRRQARILEEFLDSLPATDRTVLLLYMEGLSYGEIGEVTGFAPGTVGVRLHRLKQRYIEEHLEE